MVQRRIGEGVRKRLSDPSNARSMTFSAKDRHLVQGLLYMDTFAKIKLEASGYPKNCVTEEQKTTVR